MEKVPALLEQCPNASDCDLSLQAGVWASYLEELGRQGEEGSHDQEELDRQGEERNYGQQSS